jgi:hypothetical protein
MIIKEPKDMLIIDGDVYQKWMIPIRHFFGIDSHFTKEQKELFPNIENIDKNAVKNRRRNRDDKSKKDNIICTPFIGIPYGQPGIVSVIDETSVNCPYLNRIINAIFEANSFAHRIEMINEFLNNKWKTPILQGYKQKNELKELTNKFRDTITDEEIDLTNKTFEEIRKLSKEAYNYYLDFCLDIVVMKKITDPKSKGRNGKWFNSGAEFKEYESLRSLRHEVIDHIDDCCHHIEHKNDDKILDIYKIDSNTYDGLLLKDETDKEALFFSHGLKAYIRTFSMAKQKELVDFEDENYKTLEDKILSTEHVKPNLDKIVKKYAKFQADFIKEVLEIKKRDRHIETSFATIDLLQFLIYYIESIYDHNEFKIKDNDWKKFAEHFNNVYRTLETSNDMIQKKSFVPSSDSSETYPVRKWRNLLTKSDYKRKFVGFKLFLDLFLQKDLNELGVVITDKDDLSGNDKKTVLGNQTKNLKIYDYIDGREIQVSEGEYAHIFAKCLGILKVDGDNSIENIRFTKKVFNRMMGFMNLEKFKKYYIENKKYIDDLLGLN